MDYLKLNKEGWNKRTAAHLNGAFYEIDAFKKGKTSLKHIELGLLGDIRGKDILHLQCHFGQDSLSLARMGANVTGVDMSDKGIEAAEALRDELGLKAEFICCNVLELQKHLDRKFDMIFATYGIVGWHPEFDSWAKVASHFLRSGGELLLAEFHPMAWMFDPKFEYIMYPYFNTETFHEQIGYSYGSEKQFIDAMDVSWNHPMCDIISALIDSGLTISHFKEYNYTPYDLFHDSKEVKPEQFIPQNQKGRIALTYSIKATK